MYLLKIRMQLERLHYLIKQHSTGTPQELADKLGVTDRTIKNLIAQLRLMDADICFCSKRQTYYYRHPVKFKFGFELLGEVQKTDNDTTYGGG
jgi:transcriptional antiterminator